MTAISLIKQSKVASDDRCKILISSLQVSAHSHLIVMARPTHDLKHDIKDTLHGIENKSYGAQHRSRHSPDRRLSLKLRIVIRLFA